jgi:hypothetical protein
VLYPGHLQSALSALKYLVNTTARDPSTIILAGDSAGGNLTAELMLHLGHPHPKVEPFPLDKKLKGSLLISPWVTFETESPSFTANANSDILTVDAVNKASSAFIGKGNTHDEYSEPFRAPAEWWRECADSAVEDVLIWGGGGEILIDGIKEFSKRIIQGYEGTAGPAFDEAKVGENGASGAADGFRKLQSANRVRAQLIVSPNEAHEEMIIDHLLYIRGEQDGSRKIKKWLVELMEKKPTTEKVEAVAEVTNPVENGAEPKAADPEISQVQNIESATKESEPVVASGKKVPAEQEVDNEKFEDAPEIAK